MIAKIVWWFGKEAREQRLLFAGAMAACSLMVAITMALQHADFESIGPESQAMLVLWSGSALFLFGIAAEVFASESRRNSMAYLQRLPGALLPALLGKLAYCIVGTAVLCLWTAITVAVAWWIVGHGGLGASVLLAMFTAGSKPMVWTPIACLLVWIALISVWLPRPGASALAAALTLGALLAGPVWLLRRYPDLAHLGWSLCWLFGFLAAAGVPALAFAFLRGLRFGKTTWPSFRAGLLVLVPILITGTALGAVEVRRWWVVDPRSVAGEITRCFLGADDRTLYATVSRPKKGALRGGLSRAWTLDLESGEWSPLHEEFGQLFDDTHPLDAHHQLLGPVPCAVFEPLAPWSGVSGPEEIPADLVLTWYDTRAGSVVKTLPAATSVPELEAFRIRAALQSSTVRDPSNRRCVLSRGRVCKDDGSELPLRLVNLTALPLNERTILHTVRAIPGGFLCLARLDLDPYAERIIIDAEDGSVVAWNDAHEKPGWWLSPRRVLVRRTDDHGEGGSWWVRSRRDPTRPEFDAQLAPGAPLHGRAVVHVVDRRRVLVVNDERSGFEWWNPDTGARWALRWEGSVPDSIDAHDFTRAFVRDERGILVVLQSHSKKLDWIWIDRERDTARVLDLPRDDGSGPVAILDGPRFLFLHEDDSLVLSEGTGDGRRYD